MIKKKNEDAGKLSLRKSVLVWTAGILIGWGAAFILIVQLIKTSVSDGRSADGTQIVSTDKRTAPVPNPEDIEPAAGTPDPAPKK
jgi:hypothetical protein